MVSFLSPQAIKKNNPLQKGALLEKPTPPPGSGASPHMCGTQEELLAPPVRQGHHPRVQHVSRCHTCVRAGFLPRDSKSIRGRDVTGRLAISPSHCQGACPAGLPDRDAGFWEVS